MDLKLLNKANEINDKIKQLEKVLDILGNYDAKITCTVGSYHNHNDNKYISEKIPLELITENISQNDIKENINNKVKELYMELGRL